MPAPAISQDRGLQFFLCAQAANGIIPLGTAAALETDQKQLPGPNDIRLRSDFFQSCLVGSESLVVERIVLAEFVGRKKPVVAALFAEFIKAAVCG
jgi:hypothetical protein